MVSLFRSMAFLSGRVARRDGPAERSCRGPHQSDRKPTQARIAGPGPVDRRGTQAWGEPAKQRVPCVRKPAVGGSAGNAVVGSSVMSIERCPVVVVLYR